MTAPNELTPELKAEIIGWLMDSIAIEKEFVFRGHITIKVLKLKLDGQLLAEVTV
jgi:hypothetical protein